jgi:N-acetylmuramoyl-L-alanine amidase
MDPSIYTLSLPYESRLSTRVPESIDLVVIHCTELPDLQMARQYGEQIQHESTGTGNSGHFYIDRDGRIEQWVDIAHVAHHVRGFNERSIGIELINSGRYPDWLNSERQQMSEPYTAKQIASLLSLLRHLCSRLETLRWIAGHDDLDREHVTSSNDPAASVRRKVDPGPLFPWDLVNGAVNLQTWSSI